MTMTTAGATSVGDRAGALDPVRACHDLLVRLAGRLPDQLLWRLRDWLADNGYDALARTLPRALVRHRTGLTDAERALLGTSVGQWGARQRLLDAVLPLAELEDSDADFEAFEADGWDFVDLVLAAVVRGTPGAEELHRTWRMEARSSQRVVLVKASDSLPGLTGTLQRVLRAHGDRPPCVEVLAPWLALAPYHRQALAASCLLWRAG